MTYEQTKELMIEIRSIMYEALDLSLSEEPRDWAKALASYVAASSGIERVLPGLVVFLKQSPDLLDLHAEICSILDTFDAWKTKLKAQYGLTGSKDGVKDLN